jgi:plastocyanin
MPMTTTSVASRIPRRRWWVAITMIECLAAIVLASGQVAARDQTVSIVDFEFRPSDVTVTAGDVVTWTNDSDQAHTVTADDGTFDSAALDPGDPFATVFTVPGVRGYHCTIHPDMRARVTVNEAAPTGSASEEPSPPTGTRPPTPTPGASSATPGPTATVEPAPESPTDIRGMFQWIILALTIAIALVLVRIVTARRS